jgi:hypothetical protein
MPGLENLELLRNIEKVLQGRLAIWDSFENACKRVGEEESRYKLDYIMLGLTILRRTFLLGAYSHLEELPQCLKYTQKLFTSEAAAQNDSLRLTEVNVW